MTTMRTGRLGLEVIQKMGQGLGFISAGDEHSEFS